MRRKIYKRPERKENRMVNMPNTIIKSYFDLPFGLDLWAISISAIFLANLATLIFKKDSPCPPLIISIKDLLKPFTGQLKSLSLRPVIYLPSKFIKRNQAFLKIDASLLTLTPLAISKPSLIFSLKAVNIFGSNSMSPSMVRMISPLALSRPAARAMA